MRLLLVRHGESICGVEGIVGGVKGCTGLTDEGKAQAARLRDRLARTGEATPAVVYASTLPRAIQTAEIIAPAVGADDVRIDHAFCEFVPGDIDGTRWDDWTDRFDVIAHPRKRLAGGDSLYTFRRRVRGLLDRLEAEHDGHTVMACCHGGVIMTSMHLLLAIPSRRTGLTPSFTSITEWERSNGSWTLVRYNDTSHLV